MAEVRLPSIKLGGDWSTLATDKELELAIGTGADDILNRNFKELYEYLDALSREMRIAKIAR